MKRREKFSPKRNRNQFWLRLTLLVAKDALS